MGVPFGPQPTKTVWHFNSFMARVTKIPDFVYFSICLVPLKLFLKKELWNFEKLKKIYISFWHQRVSPPFGKKIKIFGFFPKKLYFFYLNLNSTCSQLSFEVYISIVTQIFKFFKFLVYKMSFLILMIPGFIAVKIYNPGDYFWFQMKDKYQNMYFQTSFDKLVAFL